MKQRLILYILLIVLSIYIAYANLMRLLDGDNSTRTIILMLVAVGLIGLWSWRFVGLLKENKQYKE